MAKGNNYIIIWKDEQDWDAWKDYCNATGSSRNSSYIKIFFNPEDCEEGSDE